MDFTRKGVAKKQKNLVSKLPRNKHKASVSLFKLFLVLFLAVIVVIAGAGFGALKGILDDTPVINAKDLIPTGYQTTIRDQNGKEIVTLANFDANREYVYYDDIPELLANSFIAIEDKRFWEHHGIDVRGIMRAISETLQKNKQGASTLTQQLIKYKIFNVGLDEDTFLDSAERKIQEQYLAIQIEKVLSKKQIIEYYLNTIYLGQGRYGVQTAAEYYFDKSLDELTVSECAVLAAIPQNPSKYDPVSFPHYNAERRLLVLDNMLEQGYITQAEYDAAIDDNVYSRISKITVKRKNQPEQVYSYYIDEVINQLQSDLTAMGYSEDEASTMIFSGGLDVRICQDAEIQNICDEILNDDDNYPVKEYILNYALTLAEDNGDTHNYSENMMVTWFQEVKGDTSFNLIFSSPEEARAAADEYKAAMMEESGYNYLLESYKVVVQPQISFTLMDQKTGQVKAIVGGRGKKTEDRSFNRATEAKRQPGSTFKVLAAFLPALDGCGMSLAKTYVDEPYEYANGVPVRNWYGEKYRGPCSIRDAITSSLNIIAVKTITDVTPELAYDYLLKLGFTTLVERRTTSSGMIESDINQSMALGGLTDGIYNLEITAAYAAIANEGRYIKPVFYTEVYDHEGNLIIDNRTPEQKQVISEQNAWLLTNAMHDVVTVGTGGVANSYTGMYTAGKTGTTSSNFDFWFCGYNPYYTASIWIGYDLNTNFNAGNYHKNMWRKIMDTIIETKELDVSAGFEKPDGIVSASVCSQTGLLPSTGCPTHGEYFAEGTIPGERCKGNKKITLCDESHLPATNTCPHTTDYYYYENEDESASGKKKGDIIIIDADFEYDNNIINETCPLHPEDPNQKTDEEGNPITEEPTTGDEKTEKFKIVTLVNGYGGSITPTTSVKKGKSITIYMTPDKGYEIADVSVDGKSVGVYSEYTFSKVKKDHTICVTFQKKDTEAPTTEKPTTEAPTTEEPTTTEKPTTEKPTTEAPTTEEPTTEAPTTEAPTTEAPTTEAPTDSTDTSSGQSVTHSFQHMDLLQKIFLLKSRVKDNLLLGMHALIG